MSEHVSTTIDTIENAIDRLNVKAVFGEPIEEGDIILIPVAEVTYGFGYGYGFGRTPTGTEEEALEESEEEAPGGGAGGGAGGAAKPRGYIRISPDGVRYEAILDEQRIAMAGIFLSAWAILWVAKAISAVSKAVAARRK